MSKPKNLVEPVETRGPADELLEACMPVPEAHRADGADSAVELLASNPEAAAANLWVAAATGEVDAAQDFLDNDPGLASRRGGPRQWEPLLYLCFSRLLRTDHDRAERMIEIARRLLDAGADPNAHWIDPQEGAGNRETPLYGAAGIANRPELVRLLIEHGADPNDGETAYHMVEHRGVPSADLIFPLLDPLHQGMALGHLLDYEDLDGLRKLLELGGNPDGPTPFANQPIHQAVWRGRRREYFALLVGHGADVNRRNKIGKTAYALAARAGQRETMAWLAELGADEHLDPPDDFLAACALGDREKARRRLDASPGLIEKLSDVDRAVICEAAAAGNVQGLETMIAVGWDVDTRGNVWGEPPLHRAAMGGHGDAVETLLAHGADRNLRDRCYGADAAGWAAHGGHPKLAERLESTG